MLSEPRNKSDWSWATFIPLLFAQLWAAHACVFFAHEYAHTFVAWALGWKANPLALDYAHPTLKLFLAQLGIDQNIDMLRIFASHHAIQAGVISAAGMVIGNAFITYPLSRWGYRIAKLHAARGWAMFCYWVCVASVGNLIDYVPIRTFVSGNDLFQDMYAAERGFGWSPWTLLLIFGIPTAMILAYFFSRIEPRTLRWLFPYSAPKRVLLALLTAFILFDFYGAAGLSDGGPTAHTQALVSMLVVAPIAALITAVWMSRSHNA